VAASGGVIAKTELKNIHNTPRVISGSTVLRSEVIFCDRFFTKDYTAEVYTQFGLDWIDNNSMLTVLRRHYPTVSPALFGVQNGFAPWRKVGVSGH
jgi:hypothetical protein